MNVFHTIEDIITKVLLQDQITGSVSIWNLWIKGVMLHLQ